jgi:hypothetical protein
MSHCTWPVAVLFVVVLWNDWTSQVLWETEQGEKDHSGRKTDRRRLIRERETEREEREAERDREEKTNRDGECRIEPQGSQERKTWKEEKRSRRKIQKEAKKMRESDRDKRKKQSELWTHREPGRG